MLAFAKPIEKYAIPYFIYTLFYALFNAFSYAMMIPVINTLFSQEGLRLVTEMPAFALNKEYASDLLSYVLYSVFGENYNALSVLILLAVIMVIATMMSNAFRYLGNRVVENMRINMMRNMRNMLYSHIIYMNLAYFTNSRKGDIMSRIMSDVMTVRYTVTNTLQVVIREPFLIIGYVFVMVTISWKLSAFSAIYLPVMALTIGYIVKRLRRSAMQAQETFGELNSVLDESLSGMKVVKGYNAEGFFKSKFAYINQKYSNISKKMAYRQQLASPMSEFLGILAAAGLVIYGGSLAINGTLSAGGFTTFLLIFTQVMRPIRSLTDAFANLNQGLASGERVLELLDAENPIKNAPDAAELAEFKGSIEFRDVRFSYEEREVIRGISFTVRKGETVALVGPSGGGKSTISDLIPRMYDVKGGEILIDGRNIKEYTLHSLRAQMGIVSHETVLFNDTIENNIRLGDTESSHEDVVRAAKVANADNFINECDLGYDTNIGDRGAKLSGGQRQRLSIAGAVLKDPAILILDEATSALDTESERLVQEALDTLLVGRTSIVIAHRLSTIKNADKILVIEDGLITEQGTHHELIGKNGTYAKLIEMQGLD